jgi:prepilin-type N-terminal cleavage/methylation domain-containing protein
MHARQLQEKYNGFSLVEMSIVIVVIGLILAGIVKGKVIVDNAKISALVAEFNTYKSAVNSFYAKYNALPGDFSEASAYWTGANTVNGNGDGKISFQNASGAYEGYQAWQHLSNENMVSLLLTGTQTTGQALLDVDVPKSKLGGGYFFNYGFGTGLTLSNVLVLGTPIASSGNAYPALLSVDGALTPKQAYNIDTKIDDANPYEGAVQATEGNGSAVNSCITTNENKYNIAIEDKKCVVAFKVLTQ